MNVPSLVTIAPALDASRYVQGAAEMERANEDIASSAGAVERANQSGAAALAAFEETEKRAARAKRELAQSQKLIAAALQQGAITEAQAGIQRTAAQERYERALIQTSQQQGRSVETQERMTRSMIASAASVDRLQASLDKTFAAQSQHQRFVERITEAHERGRITDQRRIELLDLAQQRYQRATGATQQFAAIQDRANTSSRNFGQVAQQAGFQIQDFAVQVASGQSALVAFAQQAPQFLGVFGTIGAIAGAAVAIGAVALQFLGLGKNASEAAEATNHFGNILDAITPRLTAQGAELNTLAGRYQALAREIGAAAEIAARADINARLQVLAQQRAAMTEAATQFGFSPGLLGRNVEEDATAARRLLRRLDIRESAAEIDRAAQALRAAQQFQITGDVRAFAEALDALGGRYRRLAEDQAGTLTNYVRESQAIEMLQAQIAVLRGTATEEQQRLAAAGQGINTIVEQRRAQQRAAEDAADVERRFAEALQSTINALDPAAAATQRYEEQYRVLRTALEQGTISQERYNYLIGVAVDAHQRAIDPMRAYNEELDRQARALRAQIDPQEAYRQRLEELNILLRAGKISNEEYGVAAAQAFQRINSAAQSGKELGRELGFTFSSAFEDAIIRGEKLRSVLSGIAQDIARIMLRRSITEPLANVFGDFTASIGRALGGSLFGGGAGVDIRGPGGSTTTPFGGPRASGGPVSAGTAYLIGEEGPELFVPRQSGAVVPNHAIGGGGMVVNQTIQISVGVAQTVRAEIAALLPQIKRQTIDAVADARMRGGSFAAAMGT